MLILLSPAKSLDYASRIPRLPVTTPRLLDESERLVDVMRRKSVAELAALADISDELAALNAQRWAEFSLPFTRQNARPAVLAFDGDVYRGMDVRQRFGARDYTEAGNSASIKYLTSPGTIEMEAAGAIVSGADVFAAADGKIEALPATTGTYRRIGTALEAASAAGAVIEVLPDDFNSTKTVA